MSTEVGGSAGGEAASSSSPKNEVFAEKSADSQRTAAAGADQVVRNKCLFCKIVDGKEKSNILYQDDEIVVFPDIRPAAKHHYLIVPREHIKDAKALLPSQIGLLDKLVSIANQVLDQEIKKDKDEEGNGNENSENEIVKRLGFHWPPFHTISHLHLHIIAPSDKMSFFGRMIFRANSLWFVTPEYVKERLQKMQNDN